MNVSLSKCKTGHVEWENSSVEEIVDASEKIFLGTVSTFVIDSSNSNFDGYYEIQSTGTELKGGPTYSVKVYGQKPYEYLPQSYLHIEDTHREISERDWLGGTGTTDIVKIGEHCPLNPRFVLGYRYLVMLGTDSRMSFEPVYSTRKNHWFKLVQSAARKP
ncbi:MAG: hypothetical protein ABJE00_08235 [Erythrobacter sp.]